MANPMMGEVSFEVNGAQYVFCLNTWARGQLQKRTGLTFAQFFKRAGEDWGDLELIDLFYAGLLQRHQLSDQEIGTLLDSLGQERAGKIAAEAILLAMPKQTEVAKGNGNFPAASPPIGNGIGSLPNG